MRNTCLRHDAEQDSAARASKEALQRSGRHASTIVTEIAPAPVFYRAEDYHQQYLEKRGLAHCRTK